jgi:hypothetical protein
VIVATGTTIGLKATPGDTQSQPPQVTLGYKRAEVSLVPTEQRGSTAERDASSTLAAFHFQTRWFGKTELDSFVATGLAARALTGEDPFIVGVQEATLGTLPPELAEYQLDLQRRRAQLDEAQAQRALDVAGLPRLRGKDARSSLQDHIARAVRKAQLDRVAAGILRAR